MTLGQKEIGKKGEKILKPIGNEPLGLIKTKDLRLNYQKKEGKTNILNLGGGDAHFLPMGWYYRKQKKSLIRTKSQRPFLRGGKASPLMVTQKLPKGKKKKEAYSWEKIWFCRGWGKSWKTKKTGPQLKRELVETKRNGGGLDQ